MFYDEPLGWWFLQNVSHHWTTYWRCCFATFWTPTSRSFLASQISLERQKSLFLLFYYYLLIINIFYILDWLDAVFQALFVLYFQPSCIISQQSWFFSLCFKNLSILPPLPPQCLYANIRHRNFLRFTPPPTGHTGMRSLFVSHSTPEAEAALSPSNVTEARMVGWIAKTELEPLGWNH